MSDQNQYQDYGDYGQYGYDDNNYEDDMQQQQEDYETKVELDYFEAEEMLRKGDYQQSIQSLQTLYQLAQDHNLRNWKPKILNLELQIHCRSSHPQVVLSILQRISALNRKEKYTESAIKSVIMTIKGLNVEAFRQVKEKLYEFINELDDMNQVRSWLNLIQKAIQDQQYEEGRKMVLKVNQIKQAIIKRSKTTTPHINSGLQNSTTNTATIPSSLLIQLYSHEITISNHLQTNQKPLASLLNKICLTLPQLQTESYLSDGHISIVKQAIAEIKYQQENYFQCSKLLCQAFQEQMKYGKDLQKKKYLLKINVLAALLTENQQIFTKDKNNALYHESASSFKSENDIQSLYGVVQAFINKDFNQFEEQMKTVNLIEQYTSRVFMKLGEKVLRVIKSNKLLQIIKPYRNVRISYLSRRLNSGFEQVQQMIFSLMMDSKINGRMQKGQQQSFLIMNEEREEYLSVQLENIKQIVRKYL